MSSGHLHGAHPVRAEEAAELGKLLARPDIRKAIAGYRKTDESHDVPYLGGSSNDGMTVYFDRRFVAAIKAGKVLYDGRPFDPRKYVHVHEALEGALIRVAGFDYPKAHRLASIAEAHATAHDGLDPQKYQAIFAPFVRTDEHEEIDNPPPDLLLEPYKGSPLYARLAAAQGGKGGGRQSAGNSQASAQQHAPGGAAVGRGDIQPDRTGGTGSAAARGTQTMPESSASAPAGKLTHAAVEYAPAKPGSPDKCANCEYYRGPDNCKKVKPPIYPSGWCKKFEMNDGDNEQDDAQGAAGQGDADHPRTHALAIASASHLHRSGYMDEHQRDDIHSAARAKLKGRKPFGSMAPDVEERA